MNSLPSTLLVGNPSDHLLGLVLDGGWTVTERLQVGRSAEDGTGGNFTIPYKVRRHDGTEAFLKAIDYSRAFRPGRPLSQTLFEISEAYVFECKIVEKCNNMKVDRVVKGLNTGRV